MMLHNPIRRLATGIMLAAVTLVLVPGLVLGHAELETATPADKSTVTEPVPEISGLYSESMKPEGSSLIVKDSTGAQVAKGTVDPEDDMRMVAIPASTLGNGTYLVESTSLSTDGDVAHATWTFTVAIVASPSPTAVPSASVAPSTAPTASSASPVPSGAPTPAPSGDGSSTANGGDVILPIVVALVILGAGAAYLLTRRNRPTDPA